MMREILIASRKYGEHVALVDDEDADRVLEHSWCVSWRTPTLFYPYANDIRQLLGRFIMQPESHLRVIYVNRDTFDCRRENLRIVEHFASTSHRAPRPRAASGYRGVVTGNGYFSATISARGRRYYLGSYHDPKEAAVAYDLAAYELFGDDAMTNERMGLL